MEKKKNKVTQIVFLSLIGLNVVVFLFIFGFSPKKTHEGPEYNKYIIEKLHFDKSQIKKYQSLINQHRNKLESLKYQMHFSKIQIYAELEKNEIDSLRINKLINKFNSLQLKEEKINLSHFIDIKTLCKPNQLSDYKIISKEFPFFFHRGPIPKERE
ncbi:MAG: hypothetical protein HYR91_11865 [Flavobacteriia bacterium]|nr:hypothetical protein [Flavobacteriia bacterium]